MCRAGDLNNDSKNDVAIGAPDFDDPIVGSDAGKAWIMCCCPIPEFDNRVFVAAPASMGIPIIIYGRRRRKR
ncbi:MAG: FG-GAP repeat protein [Candidatus Thermoplasmatota archaeon]